MASQSRKPPETKSHVTALASAVTNKLETDNFKAAMRLLCSDDTVAPMTDSTLRVLASKSPDPSSLRGQPCNNKGNSRFTALQVEAVNVTKTLHTFPLRSTGGPDGLTPQHLKDLHAGDPTEVS